MVIMEPEWAEEYPMALIDEPVPTEVEPEPVVPPVTPTPDNIPHNPAMWMSLMLLSLAGIAVLLFFRRKLIFGKTRR